MARHRQQRKDDRPCIPKPQDPEPFVDEAPVDRFCDLVLTGGVTSGVIYPSAAVELARRYRFRSIGGTSAGAMAAALTAAAEYCRRKNGDGHGFQILSGVPGQLAASVKVGGQSMTRLLSLFQPTKATSRLFGVFRRLSNQTQATAGLVNLLKAVAAEYIAWIGAAVIVAGVVALAVAQTSSPWWVIAVCALLSGIVAAVGLVGFAIRHDVAHGLVANGFGLCKGSESASDDKPALTDWLHAGLQGIAGLPADQPLTFGNLWHCDKPPPWLDGMAKDWRAIDLQVITSNLTHGRPYRLPDDGLSTRLFYRREDLDSYFPSEVMDFMWKNSALYVPPPGLTPEQLDALKPERFRELPHEQLPVVVAARLSLSFPFLFSAVPLWAVDDEVDGQPALLRKCWFSDGGICSNFPIHLFDAFVPMWPTFGISLGKRRMDQPQAVRVTTRHEEGRSEAWDLFDSPSALAPDDASSPLDRLFGFVLGLLATTKDWNDTTAMRMPGTRDRVARVGFERGEGELNVRLTGEEIERLARDYGSVAGRKLADKFVTGNAPDELSTAWREHRWVRFNTLLATLRERVSLFSAAADLNQHALPVGEQIDEAYLRPPLAGDLPEDVRLNARQADALDGLLQAIRALEAGFKRYDTAQPYKPDPMPNLRNRPPI